MPEDSLPPIHPWARAAPWLGLAALFGPAVTCAAVWALNIGHDYSVIAIAATVAITLAASIGTCVGGIIGMHRATAPVHGAWRLKAAVLLSLAAIGVWVLGGLVLLYMIMKVMGHD